MDQSRQTAGTGRERGRFASHLRSRAAAEPARCADRRLGARRLLRRRHRRDLRLRRGGRRRQCAVLDHRGRWGLTAAIIIPQLCDAIGVRQVRRYALTGERFGAQEARRIGLVHEVVPLTDLEAAGAKIVEQLLGNGPEALAETKALTLENAVGGMSVDDQAYARLVRMHAARRQTPEASEGLASFAEKRAADWRASKV